MSHTAMDWADKVGIERELSPTDRSVLFRIANASKDNRDKHPEYAPRHSCWVGIKKLAQESGYDESTIRRSLSRLAGEGLLDKVPRASAGGRGRKTDLIVLAFPVDPSTNAGTLPGPNGTGALSKQAPCTTNRDVCLDQPGSLHDQPGSLPAPYIDEPEGTVRRTQKEPAGGGVDSSEDWSSEDPSTSPQPIEKLKIEYAKTFSKKPRSGDDAILAEALKVASFEEVRDALRGAFGSDWHQKRGKHVGRDGPPRYDTLRRIFRPSNGSGLTVRDQIDQWIDRLESCAQDLENERRAEEEDAQYRRDYAAWERKFIARQNGDGEDPGPQPRNPRIARRRALEGASV